MTDTMKRLLGAGSVAACCVAALPAQATNGYFANGYGGASKGMAGAGVAVPAGVLGLAMNPAMGHKVGNVAGFCLTYFRPDRSTEIDPGGPLIAGSYTSRNDDFIIPCGGANFVLSDRFALGAFITANGGMNTEYEPNFFAGFGAGSNPVGVNLEQAFVSVNLSYKASETLSVGVAPILAVQRFSATGLEAFAGLSANPGKVTNQGDDWSTGFGVTVGALWEPTAELAFGASYRTRIDMQPFDKYAGLFAEGGDFDIPASATLGVAYTPATLDRLTVTAEVQRIWYSDIAALGNSNAPPSGALGAANGMGFGWKDMDIVRLGAVWRHDARWTFRSGVSHATAAFDGPSAVMNSLAPATPQWHASVGASYRIDEHWGLTGSYSHAFDTSVEGTNAALTGVAQKVKVSMAQNETAFGVTYRW
ncbi:OmpP1/FadL family transporter [Sagittula salina]|uniref:Outer membrane protein transport protein n=1 Tax=Sagittula salina TaxID=2820268 RepID=A0A940MN89_9RHOB|nr:outer membrane protein transport protein [Sagittula salina]MBP0481882.1 outer membrane protein transport protein [Sagittula salina]